MEIIPAIDLRGGKCVRLYQGDYNQETVFSEDPIEVARRWQSMGAQRLHIVDLDGAAKGNLCHSQLIADIAHSVTIPVQVGGGLRGMDSVIRALDLGVARIILGTAAVEDREFVKEACRRFANLIIVGVDARDGYVATRGWQESTTLTAAELVWQMESLVAGRFIYTDIARDGTLTEPNFEAIADIVSQAHVPVIAAGGIASVEHLKRLSKTGVEAAIVGRALYSGEIDLKQALKLP
jgi:phosphoribosylformimino-5-aminoimidazole carboxamide ribotide isomerase